MSGGGVLRQVSDTLRRRADEEAGQALVEYVLLFVLVIIGLFSLVALISGPVTGILQQSIAALRMVIP